MHIANICPPSRRNSSQLIVGPVFRDGCFLSPNLHDEDRGFLHVEMPQCEVKVTLAEIPTSLVLLVSQSPERLLAALLEDAGRRVCHFFSFRDPIFTGFSYIRRISLGRNWPGSILCLRPQVQRSFSLQKEISLQVCCPQPQSFSCQQYFSLSQTTFSSRKPSHFFRASSTALRPASS